MKKILLLAAVLLFALFCGCSAQEEVFEEHNPGGFDYDMLDISMIVDEIYANVEISEFAAASVAKVEDELILTEQFYLDLNNVISFDIRSASGKYGAADVAIIHVKEGAADAVMDSLESRKDDRINEFLNFDVYDSYAIAMDAEVYQVGELVVMLMLSDDDKVVAKGIVDKYLP